MNDPTEAASPVRPIEFFPRSLDGEKGNYWPNMMFHTVLQDWVTLGDATMAFAPAQAAALAGFDCPSAEFRKALVDGVLTQVKYLEDHAQLDEDRGRGRSAGEKYLRASVLCEHLGWTHPLFWPYSSDDKADPAKFFSRGRRNFYRALKLAGGYHSATEPIKFDYQGAKLDGLFVPARGGAAKAPVVIHFNGMHSSMQWHYTMRIPEMLADRGISSLLYDCPGTGTALHEKQLGLVHNDEEHAEAALDYLGTRSDVDGERIGVLGGSWGGYRAARVSAFCPRVKAGVSWPVLWGRFDEWIEPTDEWRERYRYWGQVATDEELFALARRCNLDGVAEQITIPFLAIHGTDELQVPEAEAVRFIAEAVNSVQAELVLLSGMREGGQHCQWDNPNQSISLMADWLAEALDGSLRVG